MQALRLSRSWKPTKLTRIAYPPFNAAVNLANPTALVGLTAVNGTAVTAMRSDGAPPLDQTAAFAFSNLGQTSVVGASFGLSGNFTAALTTNGTRYKNVPATITDTTTGAGTIATAYTDVFGGNTIASTNAITVTNYATMYVKAPTAAANVTMTNKSAISADSISIGGAAQGINALAVTGPTNLNGGSLGASSTSNFLNVNGTWNDGGTAFKAALLINVTNTASATASLLLDTQVGGVSQFSVQQNGLIEAKNNFETASGGRFSYAGRSRIGSPSAGFFTLYDVTEVYSFTIGAPSSGGATLQLGAANVNGAPVAQTLQVQSPLAGSATNTAGANFTIIGGLGTGTGTGGDIIFQTNVKTTTGTVQGTPTTVLTIKGEPGGVNGSVFIGGAGNSVPQLVFTPNSGSSAGIGMANGGSELIVYSGSSQLFGFSGATAALRSDGSVAWNSSAIVTGAPDTNFSRASAGVVQLGTTANNALGSLNLTNLTATGVITVPGAATAALTSTATFTSGAGAGAGTLTNAPSSGNPTSWIKIVDNGVTRYIPAW